MSFKIISDLNDDKKMYPGMLIEYIVRPVLKIPLHWVTEITHVNEPFYFVDEQRFGPYAFWHHKHFIKEIPGGIEVTDKVDYKLPLGIMGKALNNLLIIKKLENIFSYRERKLEDIFGNYTYTGDAEPEPHELIL